MKTDIYLDKERSDQERELEEAFKYQKLGQLQKAELTYKKILKINPDHGKALHFLGLIAHQKGNYHMAADLINKAVRIYPQ